MSRWIVAGVAVLCAGVGVGLWLANAGPRHQAGNLELPPSATPPATPPTPVVLTNVVEVANLEPLLDPRAKDTGGVPFDTDPTTVPVSAPDVPGHIPPATDAPAAAPMPREVTAEQPLFDPSRACWYGEHRLPRQIGGGMTPGQHREMLEMNHPLRPHGGQIGVGYFF